MKILQSEWKAAVACCGDEPLNQIRVEKKHLISTDGRCMVRVELENPAEAMKKPLLVDSKCLSGSDFVVARYGEAKSVEVDLEASNGDLILSNGKRIQGDDRLFPPYKEVIESIPDPIVTVPLTVEFLAKVVAALKASGVEFVEMAIAGPDHCLKFTSRESSTQKIEAFLMPAVA